MEGDQEPINSKGNLNPETEPLDVTNGLSSAEIRSLAALCDTFFPSLPLAASALVLEDSMCSKDVEEFYRASFPNGWGPSQIAETMNNLFKPAEVKMLKTILWLLSTSVGTFILAGRHCLQRQFPFIKSFYDMPLPKRERVLLDWSTSPLFLFRVIFKAFKASLAGNHFSRVDERDHNPFWKAIGYCGPDPIAINAQLSPKPLEGSVIDASALSPHELDSVLQNHRCKLLEASDIDFLAGTQTSSHDHGIECDVVIVGSGSGGGVAAAVLAKAGFKVIVLEKGRYMAREDLTLLEGPSTRELYDEGGMLSTDDAGIVLLAGSTVGGGTAVNWSASFRTPEHVLRGWEENFGLHLFTSSRYHDAMDQVCKRLGVQDEIKNENLQNTVLRKGCEALGYHVENIPRNATADHYCGWCSLGCRRGMKQATSETWLVDAANCGAVILSRCSAQRVLHVPSSGGRKARKAVGVVAKIENSDDQRQIFIKARATIIASGALRTPPLLRSSGLKNPHIGKNLHLHPVQMLWGYFPPGIVADGTCYEGGIMTAFSNEAAGWKGSCYGAIIQTPILHPGIFATVMPWKSGEKFKETMVRYPRTCSLIVLLRDKGSGTVESKPDGSLNIHYKFDKDDEERAKEGVEKGLRILAAAGAVEVGTHDQGMESFKVEEGSNFEEYLKRAVLKKRTPLYSAHQMGSCRMGGSAGGRGVCGRWECASNCDWCESHDHYSIRSFLHCTQRGRILEQKSWTLKWSYDVLSLQILRPILFPFLIIKKLELV